MKKQNIYDWGTVILYTALSFYLLTKDIQKKREFYSLPSSIEQIVKNPEPINNNQKGLLEIIIPEN